MDIGTIPAGSTSGDFRIQTSVAGQVNLVNTAGMVFSYWDGDAPGNRENGMVDGGAGNWSATRLNWTDADGRINGAYSPNPTFAVFQGTGAAGVFVDTLDGPVAATGMQFASDGYVLLGDAVTLSPSATIRVGDGSADDASKTTQIFAALDGVSITKLGAGTLELGSSQRFSDLNLNQGVVAFSMGLGLGHSAGVITFNGGSLLAQGTTFLSAAKQIRASSDARIDVDLGQTLTVDGEVTGLGNLVKAGQGTLTLTNRFNAYGDTIVEAGTLIGDARSISGDIETAGLVVFDQATSGTFAGAIFGRGGVAGQMEKRGAGSLFLTGASALDWTVTEGALSTDATFIGDLEIATGAVAEFYQTGFRDYGGALTGGGYLGVEGGILRFTGDNTGYTGRVGVSDATLTLKSATAGTFTASSGGRIVVDDVLTGRVSVVAGDSSLTGTGRIDGEVNVVDGTLEGSSGNVLSMASLSLISNSKVAVALGAPSDTSLFDVAGNLRLDGTLNITDAGSFGVGVYRIFDYGGTLTNNGLVIGTTPAGTNAAAMAVQTSVAGQVNLVNASGAEIGFWDGGTLANRDNGSVDGGSGTWNITNENWTTTGGAVNAPYSPNPTFAVFQGMGGTVTIDNSASAVLASGLQFASDGYTLDGMPLSLDNGGALSTVRVGDGSADDASKTATITSQILSGSILKQGAGTLVLGANNFFSRLELAEGTVAASFARNLGTAGGGIEFTGGTLRVTDTFASSTMVQYRATADARFAVDAGQTLTLSGIVFGAGDVVKTGAGTLTLTNSGNAYGDTIVQAGTLVGTAASIEGNIENAGLVVFDQGDFGIFTGNIGGFGGTAGTMEKRGGSILQLTGSSSLDWVVSGGTLSSEDADFSGDIDLGTTGNFGFVQGGDRDYTGEISGTGSVVTNGGTLRLTGDNAGYTGTLRVEGGGLTIDSAFGGNADVRTGGRLVVNDVVAGGVAVGGGSSFLAGSGTITGSVTLLDGTLEGTSGRVLSMGALSMVSQSSMNVTLGAPSGMALFDVAGDLTLDGALNVTDAGGFSAGVYRLVDYGGTLTDNGLDIGTIPAGATLADLSVQTAVAGQVNLVNTGGATLSFWDGDIVANRDNDTIDGGTGTWNATNSNWTTATGSFNAPYSPNPTFAVFQGTAGTITIDDTDGQVKATGLQFASDGYAVDGDALGLSNGGSPAIVRVGDGSDDDAIMVATISADLTGATLRKEGDGTLVLGGAHLFDGLEMAAGTLAVSAEGNMGSFGSTVTFQGGTLRSTDTFATDAARFYDAVADARFEVDAGRTLTVDGIVYGLGDLVKSGEGTLVLTNTGNSYNDTIVAAGTLTGNAGSIVGNIANAGTVIFDQASDGTYAFAISGHGGTSGVMEKRGAGELTLIAASSLDWTLTAGRLISDNAAFSGDVGIASGARFVFVQGGARVYGGEIAGTGAFAVEGGSLQLTGNSGAFGGTTEVLAATLRIDDVLGGSGSFGTGSRLAGTGTLGSGMGSVVTLASGATLAPGNSIGTLTVNGDLVMTTGSVYEVEVAPGGTDNDLVAVTGTATLAGGVTHIGLTGDYASNARYTILTAGGGISGTFDSVTSDFAFLDPTLGYGANAVTLTLARNDVGFADVGRTPNQRATANGLDDLGAGTEPYDSVLTLGAAAARDAYDQLSGEGHASVMTGMVEDSDEIRDAVSDRMQAGLGARNSAPAGGTMSSKSVAVSESPVWARATGTWRQMASDGNAARYASLSGGLLLGADAMVEDVVRLGFLAGFGQATTDVAARNFSADSNSYHIGVYAGAEVGGFTVSGGAAYSWHQVDATRRVAFAGFTDTLTADYGAGVVQAFGELSYRIDAGAAFFEPYVNVAHVRVNRQGFTEAGGAAALTASPASYSTTYATVGLRAETQFVLGDATGTLHGALGWRQAFGDRTPDQDVAFAGAGPFSIAGAPIIGGAALIEAGIAIDLSPQASFGLSYDGQISSASQSHGISASFNLNF